MKTFTDGRHENRFKSFCDGAWQMFVLSLLAFTLIFFASEVQAARIAFSPGELTVTAEPGEMVALPVTVSLEETSLPNSYASFGLTYTGGTLNRSWLNSQVYTSLNSWYKSRQVILRLMIPENAESGSYQGVLRTVWMRSNETIPAAELKINLEVDSFVACSQVPLFSDISSSVDEINVSNNKEVAIELSGTIEVLEECNLENTRYQLIDEYGELDKVKFFEADENGAFNVAIPLIASRDGKDKDGRLYTVKFMAESEAGAAESAETSIVVAHDNRKK